MTEVYFVAARADAVPRDPPRYSEAQELLARLKRFDLCPARHGWFHKLDMGGFLSGHALLFLHFILDPDYNGL